MFRHAKRRPELRFSGAPAGGCRTILETTQPEEGLIMMRRRDFLALAAAAPVFGKEVPTRPAGKVETLFRSPGPKPNGLQATQDGLWILDQGDNRAYLVSYQDGKVLRALDTDSKAGSGITFDGEAIWIASTYSREIIRADARTGRTLAKYDTPCAGVVKWTNSRISPLAKPAPESAGARRGGGGGGQRQATGAHGMEWKDGKLWIAVPPSQTIYRVNPKGFVIEHQFPTAGDRPHGLGWEGKFLWCADSNLNAFFKHDPATGEILARIQLAEGDPLPHGMTIWRGMMWYCDDVGVVCRFKM
jgi:sugar lactone lactonase YvrE